MADNPIAFIDSGVGGLPYLDMARKLMPLEKFVYIADNENFPYGEKSADQLKKLILMLIKTIISSIDPKLIVIACNTASVVALSLLREEFGIPFVGVVPAIKPAGEYSGNGNIGLIATRKTVEDPYTTELIIQFASNCKVEKYAAVDLVDFVENRYFSSTENEKIEVVSRAAGYFDNLNIDALVLGCTHFVFLKEYFRKYLNDSVDLIDSVEGVGQQILRIIKSESIESKNLNKKKQLNHFFITGNKYDRSKYLEFASEFGLVWGGHL